MRFEHRRVLVAQREFNTTVLGTLETTGVGEVRANRAVFRRRHGRQYIPGMHQLFHDFAHPRQHFECRAQLVTGDIGNGFAQLMQHQFHPQLGSLMLDDEQHLVMVGRARMLGVQNVVQVQVVAITHRLAEVEQGFFILHDLLVMGHGDVLRVFWLSVQPAS